ncbi:MAG: lipid A-modifier LpxR family protein, partial [Rickettsiales bacterium]
MRPAVLLLCAFLAAAPFWASAEERLWPRGTFTAQIENDRIANTDRHYTNGIRLAWVSDKAEDGP